ncbi:conserved hypothetical protein, partial [Ricinus communis]
LDHIGIGPDEANVVGGEYSCEFRVLRQKSITGMHGIDLQALAEGDDLLDVEMRSARAGAHDFDGFIRLADDRRQTIAGVINRHAGDALVLQAAQNAQRNFAAIGDQHFIEWSGGHRASDPGMRKASVELFSAIQNST